MPRVMRDVPRERIVDFCKRWKITEFAIFGSATRADFHPDSDIDVLVAFAPDASWSLFDHVEMQDELAAIFGRHVDLESRRGIECSRNLIRRQAILESAEVVCVSRCQLHHRHSPGSIPPIVHRACKHLSIIPPLTIGLGPEKNLRPVSVGEGT